MTWESFVRFLSYKVALPPPPFLHSTLWKWVVMHSLHLRSGESCFISLRAKHLRKLFRIFSAHEIWLFSTIYLFIHLSLSVCIHWYMYIYITICVIVQYFFFVFVAKIVPGLVIGTSLSLLLCPFNIPSSLWELFVCFYFFLFCLST